MTPLSIAFDADEKDTVLTGTVNKSQASVKFGVLSGSGSASNGKLDTDPRIHKTRKMTRGHHNWQMFPFSLGYRRFKN
jgi:hypothetical protein